MTRTTDLGKRGVLYVARIPTPSGRGPTLSPSYVSYVSDCNESKQPVLLLPGTTKNCKTMLSRNVGAFCAF